MSQNVDRTEGPEDLSPVPRADRARKVRMELYAVLGIVLVATSLILPHLGGPEQSAAAEKPTEAISPKKGPVFPGVLHQELADSEPAGIPEAGSLTAPSLSGEDKEDMTGAPQDLEKKVR